MHCHSRLLNGSQEHGSPSVCNIVRKRFIRRCVLDQAGVVVDVGGCKVLVSPYIPLVLLKNQVHRGTHQKNLLADVLDNFVEGIESCGAEEGKQITNR